MIKWKISIFKVSGVSVLAGNTAQLSQILGMKDDNKLYVNVQYWISPETRNTPGVGDNFFA